MHGPVGRRRHAAGIDDRVPREVAARRAAGFAWLSRRAAPGAGLDWHERTPYDVLADAVRRLDVEALRALRGEALWEKCEDDDVAVMLVRRLMPELEELIAAGLAARILLALPPDADATDGGLARAAAASGERAPPQVELVRCLTSAPQGPPLARPSFRAARVAAAHSIRETPAA